MRPIKFRGKRIDNGEWVYGYYFITPLTDEATGSKPEDGWFFLTGRQRHCISKDGCVYEVLPETVGQFTGLHDKNGVEIYEGDLIKHVIESNFSKQRPLSSKSYQVLWCNQESRFYIDNTFKSGMIFKGYEVIGNVHEERSKK